MRKKLKLLILICSLLLTILVTGLLSVFYEGEKPLIKVSQDIKVIGRNSSFDIAFSDMKSGLRGVSITLSQDGEERIIHSADFPAKGHNEETVSVAIDYKVLKLHDGTATLHVSAIDYSLRKNRTVISTEMEVDITPPRISLLNSSNYINPGGSCIITFTLSEEVKGAGVSVNDDFFPAYPVTRSGNSYYINYFAAPLAEMSPPS